MPFFQHYAELAAGSAAEAIMNTVGGGQDGHFFTVARGRVVRIRTASLQSAHTAGGFGQMRLRQSQVNPATGAPALVATDPIVGLWIVPLGAGGVQDFGSQPIEAPGLTNFPTGQTYYFTIQQPAPAVLGQAIINVTGRTNP